GELPARRTGGHFCARRRLRSERASRVVILFARVFVPSPADGKRLPGPRYRLSRIGRLRPRLAHGNLPSHGRQGPGRTGGYGALACIAARGRRRTHRPIRRKLRPPPPPPRPPAPPPPP